MDDSDEADFDEDELSADAAQLPDEADSSEELAIDEAELDAALGGRRGGRIGRASTSPFAGRRPRCASFPARRASI